jgi:hypothetical protein
MMTLLSDRLKQTHAIAVSLLIALLLTATLLSPILAEYNGKATILGEFRLIATFHCISVYANFTGDDDADNSATLEYRESGGSWKTGMDLVVDRRATVATSSGVVDNPFKYQWRGSIIGLTPNTSYDVRVTFTDPDGVSGTNPVSDTITTMNETISLGTGNIRYVSKTGSNSNDGTAPDSSHAWSTIAYGLANIGAGGTLYILAGTYNESNLAIPSGTSWSNLTTLSNYGSDTVIVDSQDAEVCNFSMTGRNYWQLQGITMQRALQSNIYLASCLHFVIDGCTLKLCGHTGGTQHPTLYLVSGDGHGIIKNNQFLGGRGGFTGEQDNDAIACRLSEGHFIIYENTVYNADNWDAIGGANGASIKGGFYRDSDLYNNTIAHNRDDGFELEGGGVNNRCWGNIITDNGSPGYGSAISTVALLIGPTYVFNNVCDSPYQCGVKTGGFGYTPEVTSSGHLFVYNNTFYGVDPTHPMEFGVGAYGNTHNTWNQHYKNNIFQIFSSAAWANRNGPGDGDEFDYNNLYRGSAGTIAGYGSTRYSDLATLRSGTGQEVHGIAADSLFVNAAGGDFRLQASSPCKDAAVIIAGFNDVASPYAYEGSAPDIGAFEFASGYPQTRTLAMAVSGNSSTIPPVGSHQYANGEIVEITATANLGWAFYRWLGDVADPYSSTTTVVMDSDKVVTANYIPVSIYLLTLNVVPLGITNIDGGGWYNQGTHLQTGNAPEIIPGDTSTRYVFETWIVDDIERAGNPISITMDSAHKLTARYKTEYYLTVESEYGKAAGSGWYDSGATAQIQVPLSYGLIVRHFFTEWSGDAGGSIPSTCVQMDRPKNIVAGWRSNYTQLYILTGIVVLLVGAGSVLVLRRKLKL